MAEESEFAWTKNSACTDCSPVGDYSSLVLGSLWWKSREELMCQRQDVNLGHN